MPPDLTDPEHWTHIDPTFWQRLLRKLVTRPGRLLYRYKAYGHYPRVPKEGGFIMAPGPHGAYLDPFVFALGQPRTRLRFMCKKEALEWPTIGRFLRWGGAFPVDRSGGKGGAALEIARHVLESGDGMVMFPEGKIYLEDDGLTDPRSGVARLALASGVPVVPVAAYGIKRARAYGKRFHWPRATVVWGEPLVFAKEVDPSRERIEAVRDEIWASVENLFNQAKSIHEGILDMPIIQSAVS